METLILTEKEVKELISMEEAINAVEGAFKLHALKKVQMPPKIYLFFENGDLRAMPALVGNYAGIKWVNSHSNNPSIGLPTVMALYILNDPSTGFPLSVMDATFLTSLRTGAAGGVAVKHLARKDSKVAGFIGCGRQAYFQLEAINKILSLEKVKGFDISKEALKKFGEFCLKIGIDFEACSAEDASNSDILITATPSTKPVVMNEWVKDGTHINAIGADAPGKQELDERILLRSKIVVDDLEQALHGGEINVAYSRGLIKRENIYATLGEVVAKIKPGRERYEEITIFDSTGLAIQDVAVAKVVYENAIKKGVGRYIKFFE
ncbi:MAG: alanine dehydrogenase [Archaeoglobaceae archaeon]|nr:alanine dehydrogenase [Archaeoglobaceae archaeon]MCX8151491.1 alanine dehydrogenase [Archaeoglobaceae archaeon]MDW8014253.1 alanine dehydrogenase [Archaeoglobaceae archaeon]